MTQLGTDDEPRSTLARMREFAARHRTTVTIVGTVLATALLAAVLAGHQHEFSTALTSASIWTLLLAMLLQITALLARSEAWHWSVTAAGGTVPRRVLYRASGLGYAGTLVNAQLGMVARIAALRRSAPANAPAASTLVAAEFPILAVEAMLAALTSFTLVGPLGVPWWLPIVALAVVGALSVGLRRLALRTGRQLWRGLAILRSAHGGRRLVGFVLIAVFAQISRNWLLLHAVGVNASLFDAIAVLIAMVTLSQLPIGPSVGAGAAVLILGGNGVAAVAAAGVLSTATGAAGGLCFALWAGADGLRHRRSRRHEGELPAVRAPAAPELSPEPAGAGLVGPR